MKVGVLKSEKYRSQKANITLQVESESNNNLSQKLCKYKENSMGQCYYRNIAFNNVGESVNFFQDVYFNGDGIVRIGNRCNFGYEFAPHFHGFHQMFQARYNNSVISIGNDTIFSNDVTIVAVDNISIGEDCLIGDRVSIYDCDFHEINPLYRKRSKGNSKPVSIGDRVWIGSQVMILKGVTIGDNSIIGAGSVVTKDIPPNCIAAGNPAKVIVNNIWDYYGEVELKEYTLFIKDRLLNSIENDQVDKAIKLLEEYDNLSKGVDNEIYSMKAVLNIKQGKYEVAEMIIRQGLDLMPDNFDLLYNLAYLYDATQRQELAIQYYKLLESFDEASEFCIADRIKALEE